ncbi:AmmeMemoRadiSam system radical SAM enzyme [Anaeromicropila herbilytica]|uniref:AmmeMemoRadiSam system radical SAM enzyme n=1 Tax=Anaeromicropila herbilytica TaxID=2785025 RepID=A0A7R7ENI4_9FIRM|nr:AmmeMemoRadiSam system radical SAM enzyme [Anaeromicropila herbilytica]BCN31846.1 AmmeMemoRadiSam system radical SAM enzyme [Anaeromicropila herbilytica]
MNAECKVCMHRCNLEEGQYGRCRARRNVGGEVVASNYGKITSLALDPIEKKPLYRFYPGSKILSVGSYGCNLTCSFCQNYSISMVREEETDTITLTPEELADKASKLREHGNIGVAFTYNEPLIGYEYVIDTATILRERDMKTVVVTNGSVTKEVAKELLPYVDALNIDLKGFTKEYYKQIGGDLETVKNFIALAAKECHVELTTLVIPDENDSVEEMRQLSQWVASVDEQIPLHVTRFFPRWKMTDRNATEVNKIYELGEVARESLKYVYEGNC